MFWRPDPSAIAVDAFMFLMKGENPDCFPPVSCIPRLLRKVLRQQSTVTLVAPDWQAAWWLDLDRMLIEPPLRLPMDCMQSTGSILPNSTLTCFRISGSYVNFCNHKSVVAEGFRVVFGFELGTDVIK